MGSSKRERILGMLDGERTGEAFCTNILSSFTWEQMVAADVYWPDAHTNPELMVKLAETQYTVLGFESVRAGFCTTVMAEALGAEINMGTKRTQSPPYVTKPAFENLDEFVVPPNLALAEAVSSIVN